MIALTSIHRFAKSPADPFPGRKVFLIILKIFQNLFYFLLFFPVFLLTKLNSLL